MLTTQQTRPEGCPIDGVGIVAILQKASGPELLLQKQYRPPINKIVVEVPAGLIDAGETPEECAIRELKEETGYVGVAEQTSPVMWNGTSLEFQPLVRPQLPTHHESARKVPDRKPWIRPGRSTFIIEEPQTHLSPYRSWLLQHQPEHGTCSCRHVTT